MGSLTAHFVHFASVTSGATGDTWASGLPNIVDAHATATTAGNTSVSCSYVSSTGVITLNPTQGATGVNLIVYSRT
jgi:hypothetical protein